MSQKDDLRRAAKMVTQDSARRFVKRATFARLNARRAELIVRRGTRTPEEEAELQVLDDEAGRLINLAFPACLPDLPEGTFP